MTTIIDIPPGAAHNHLQAEIDKLSYIGGGQIRLLPGQHVCGPLQLRSNIDLHLEAGAVLAPLPDHALYANNTSRIRVEGSDRCMIIGQNLDNVAVTGIGTIDGGGRHFVIGDDVEAGVYIPFEPRLRTVVLENCRHVRIAQLTLRESSSWTMHLVHCTDVLVDSYQVLNDMRMPNTDGLVLDGCTGVTVRNAIIRTADDGIVLKTCKSVPQQHCSDISILDCVIESGSCAIKIGTETFGNVEGVTVDNCKLEASNRGLGILSRDGGEIRDIRYRNIELDCHETPFGFWGSGEALTITQLNRRSSVPAGKVRRIHVENLRGAHEGAINFYAAEPGGIADVTINQVTLTQRPGGLGTGQQQDIRPTEADLVPSKDAAGRVGAWVRDESGKIIGLNDYPGGMPGLFSHNVANLSLANVKISRPEPLPEGWNQQVILIN
ncbi:glycoside hydrolase family 28 protein [Devosia sp. BK]|uniref:glycoside hydrolase family 28 protein n=1 Tax=Devosia sp. BK TaxID=2871706 RepID=UPI00293B0EDA|nr:glycosyl hydrolase family 28 protein [Devosia sp. BK]MDV3253707.1 glycoside hydrolase family 28 protein [Devosia sp. BK]